MSYVKYREDDEQIVNDRYYMKHGSKIWTGLQEPTHYYDCKYCRAVFTDRKQLFLHIKQKHNIVRPLVVINGKVAGDHIVIHYLDTAYIELFGYDDGISVNGCDVNVDDNTETIDIAKILNAQLNNNPHCIVGFQDSAVEIDLVALSVRKNKTVLAVINQWENDISSAKRLSSVNYQELDEGSRLFLTGIYNYYIATQAKKDKSKRYDDALDILSRFNDLDGIGNCVLKIIAYRRNWINRLEMLSCDGGTDIFSVASDYYHRRESDYSALPTGKQIYIEDSTMLSLELVLLFQQKKYEQVRNRLSEISDIDDLDDLNLQDQLNLLSARLAVVAGDKRKAEIYYEKLVAPAFKEEYTLYKKGELRLNG